MTAIESEFFLLTLTSRLNHAERETFFNLKLTEELLSASDVVGLLYLFQ